MPTPESAFSTNVASLIDTRQISVDEILQLFRRAAQFEECAKKNLGFDRAPDADTSRQVIVGLFLEPSTRTRISFQVAALRLGHETSMLDGDRSSSMVKGESDVDTVLNIAAMGPDILIIRSNQSRGLDLLLPTLQIPVISAGSGVAHHPTQALLDAYTILHKGGPRSTLQGERVLIVGDIAHSRVACSNFDVLSRLGAEVGICGPKEMLPQAEGLPKGVRVFDELDRAMDWPTVYMGLRIQLERHDHASLDRRAELAREFHAHFGLDRVRLKKLSPTARILHPGPINHGVEFAPEVLQDPRNLILQQVSNGVLVRAAVLERTLRLLKLGRGIA